jgi:hypothetical protein
MNYHNCAVYTLIGFIISFYGVVFKTGLVITSKTNGYANDINLANSVFLFHISKHDTYCMGIWSERQFAIRQFFPSFTFRIRPMSRWNFRQPFLFLRHSVVTIQFINSWICCRGFLMLCFLYLVFPSFTFNSVENHIEIWYCQFN